MWNSENIFNGNLTQEVYPQCSKNIAKIPLSRPIGIQQSIKLLAAGLIGKCESDCSQAIMFLQGKGNSSLHLMANMGDKNKKNPIFQSYRGVFLRGNEIHSAEIELSKKNNAMTPP